MAAHFFVEFLQHIGSGGLVSNGEGLFAFPILGDVAALIQDGAQSILQSLVILRALANLHITEQAEHAPAPIGASPGGGAFPPFVASLRLPLGLTVTTFS